MLSNLWEWWVVAVYLLNKCRAAKELKIFIPSSACDQGNVFVVLLVNKKELHSTSVNLFLMKETPFPHDT
jgi:hypothetical protein